MVSNLHYKSMLTMMNYCVLTKYQALFLKPTRDWERRDNTFQLLNHGWSDSDCKKIKRLREKFQGEQCFWNDVQSCLEVEHKTKPYLSMAEAELSAWVTCAQHMLYMIQGLHSLGLKVILSI